MIQTAQDHANILSAPLAPAVAKAAPAITVTGVAVLGVPLQEWVYILTIVYLLLQTGAHIWGEVRKGRRGK